MQGFLRVELATVAASDQEKYFLRSRDLFCDDIFARMVVMIMKVALLCQNESQTGPPKISFL